MAAPARFFTEPEQTSLRYAYFAKHRLGFWVCVSSSATGEDTVFYDKNFTAANGYIRTKVVELD